MKSISYYRKVTRGSVACHLYIGEEVGEIMAKDLVPVQALILS